MSTPNGRKFTINTFLPSRASNNSVANEVANVFHKYPFLIPINTATGSIETFNFNTATGSTLYINSLTGPVLNTLGGGFVSGSNILVTTLTGTNIYTSTLMFTGATGGSLYASNFTGTNLTSVNITGTNLVSTNIGFTSATGGSLYASNFTGTNLTSVNITGTNLVSTNIGFTSATGGSLYASNLIGSNIYTLIFNTFFTRGTTGNTLSTLKIYTNNGQYVQPILYPTSYSSLLGSQVGSDNLSIYYNDVSRGTLSCPYTTTFICPYNGDYKFNISGWKCSSGNGQTRVIVNRNASNIYNRTQQCISTDCGYFTGIHYIFNLQIGDVCQFGVNENNTFTPVDFGPVCVSNYQRTEGLAIFCSRKS